MSKRSMDRKFAGSAVLLQEKMRQDPESYMEEYLQHLQHFESVVEVLKSNPTAVPEKATTDLIQTVTQVCGKIHGTAAERIADHLSVLLSPPCVSALSPALLRACMQGLMLLRSRGLVPSTKTLSLFLQMLAVHDKETRKMLLWHIASDIYKTNQKQKSHAENRKLQSQMHDIIQEDDGNRSRHVLALMIDLYRRQVWKDDLTVHFISQAVFLRNTRTVKTALRFLLSRTCKLGGDDSDEEEKDPGRKIKMVQKQFRVRKKTRGRERKMNNKISDISKKYQDDNSSDEDGGKEDELRPEHDPILLIRDPQGYAERLFKQLSRTSERFETRLLMMQVVSRLITTHSLLLLPFYSYLERYMEPYQRDVPLILALAVQCVHPLVPPESISPLVKTIANHFVSDKASPDAITIGLNTVREMCKRQPHVMDTTLLHDLIQYTTYREDKGVVMAARSLIRLFRVLQPDMLPTRERGRGHDASKKLAPFGSDTATDTVAGFGLLVEHEQSACADGSTRAGTDKPTGFGSDDDDDDDDDDSDVDSDELVDLSDDEQGAAEVDDEEDDDDDDSDDEEGEELEEIEFNSEDYEDDSDDEEGSDDNDDDCPDLVPVAAPSRSSTAPASVQGDGAV
eukprot:PhM_4_TR2059/c0_g3_i1/m.43203/K14856/SDA1, SDAD1; protein SDA1